MDCIYLPRTERKNSQTWQFLYSKYSRHNEHLKITMRLWFYKVRWFCTRVFAEDELTYWARTLQNTFRSHKDSRPNDRPHNNGNSIEQGDSSLQLNSIIGIPLVRRRLLLRHRSSLTVSEQAFSLPPEVNNMDYTISRKRVDCVLTIYKDNRYFTNNCYSV